MKRRLRRNIPYYELTIDDGIPFTEPKMFRTKSDAFNFARRRWKRLESTGEDFPYYEVFVDKKYRKR